MTQAERKGLKYSMCPLCFPFLSIALSLNYLREMGISYLSKADTQSKWAPQIIFRSKMHAHALIVSANQKLIIRKSKKASVKKEHSLTI